MRSKQGMSVVGIGFFKKQFIIKILPISHRQAELFAAISYMLSPLSPYSGHFE